jgi:hypothetical protein
MRNNSRVTRTFTWHGPIPAVAALLAVAASSGHAAVRHVPGDYPTMAAAVTAAEIGDTIQIASGTFAANLIFTKSLTLAGVGMNQTTLDGGNAGTVLTTTPGVTLTVQDLTIRHGQAPAAFPFGGGVLNDGDLHMERCTIWQCAAPVAGAALSNVNGSARLVDCTLLNNGAAFAGGAIANNATLTLENCTLMGNTSDTGGAVINTGDLQMTNCTVASNDAKHGGALFLHSGTTSVQYSTFNRNNASPDAGGAVLALTGFTARGTIIAGNTAKTGGDDVLGELDSDGYNLIGTNNGTKLVKLAGAGPDVVGTANAPIDPRLQYPPTLNGGPTSTLMPASNSPAIDKGGASGFPAWDQRGAHRPRDGGSGSLLADVGAVEVGPLGYTATDLHRALQLAAGTAAANASDAWLNVDATQPGVDLLDCAHLARKAVGLEP